MPSFCPPSGNFLACTSKYTSSTSTLPSEYFHHFHSQGLLSIKTPSDSFPHTEHS
jgi:hypothetical protein